jgi:CHAT domain-containing protein
MNAEDEDAAIPWELMHNGTEFVSLFAGLGRASFDSENPERPIVFTSKRLRVLVIGSNPRGDLPKVEEEAKAIVAQVEKAGGKVTSLIGVDATKMAVVRALKSEQYDVLHYCGHSEYDKITPDASCLLLRHPTEQNATKKLMASEVGHLKGDCQLKLVFLNSCYSAVQDTAPENISGISGIAQAFVKAGVPYVVGMLYPISDIGAECLADHFYTGLFNHGDPVQALTEARNALISDYESDPAWASAAIYVP